MRERERERERERVVCEHEGIKEERECTYFLVPVLTDATASAFLAIILFSIVWTSLTGTFFFIAGHGR